MGSGKKVIVIIPALNEEDNIGLVVKRIRKTSSDAFVLVINDGSGDLTEKAALAGGARVVTLPFNLGIGAAMQTGFIFARENGFDIAVQVDGDGQHDPGEIPRLLKPVIEDGADASVGSRYIEKKGDMSTLQRRTGIKMFALLISRIMGQRITDPTSGFRAMSRKAIELFSEIYPEDYPEPESLVMLHLNGLSVKEVPVSMERRASGLSSISAFGSVYYMVKVTLAILIDLCKSKALKIRGGNNAGY